MGGESRYCISESILTQKGQLLDGVAQAQDKTINKQNIFPLFFSFLYYVHRQNLNIKTKQFRVMPLRETIDGIIERIKSLRSNPSGYPELFMAYLCFYGGRY